MKSAINHPLEGKACPTIIHYKQKLCIAVINKPLRRRSLVHYLNNLEIGWSIISCDNIDKIVISDYSVLDLIVLAVGKISNTLTLDRISNDIMLLEKLLPNVPVVLLSSSDDAVSVGEGLRLGARGLITTQLSPEIIVRALILVASGGTYIPPGAIVEFVERYQWHKENQSESYVHDESEVTFTPRQLDVLRLLCQGLPNKTIGCMLRIQECSVKSHIGQLIKKMGVSNRTQLACRSTGFLGIKS